jgi:hypothetical protein
MFAGYVIFALLGKAEEYKKKTPEIISGRTNANRSADEMGLGEAFESLSGTGYFLLVLFVSPLQPHECFRSFMVSYWSPGASMYSTECL